ncbi:MAG: MerR family transcriptional regulator [Phycisphaerales bacterium]|nr:MerR family transcriptional regulator [Phycisphaerales bacterium]
MSRTSPLNWVPDDAMTLDQAVERANALLAAATSAQVDGRVRPTLDARTVRYYQTLGIVPPPRRAGGRRAVYRSTHLVRAVMTKLLQAGGARLADIAPRLERRSDQDLWQQVGDLLQSGSTGAAAQMPKPQAEPEAEPVRSASGSPTPLHAATILPGVHLLIEASASHDPDELLHAMRAWLARRQRP